MSRLSQSRRRYRLSRAGRMRAVVSEARDAMLIAEDLLGGTPVRDADGVWRQPGALRYREWGPDEPLHPDEGS